MCCTRFVLLCKAEATNQSFDNVSKEKTTLIRKINNMSSTDLSAHTGVQMEEEEEKHSKTVIEPASICKWTWGTAKRVNGISLEKLNSFLWIILCNLLFAFGRAWAWFVVFSAACFSRHFFWGEINRVKSKLKNWHSNGFKFC